jgi:hypothetical protein
MAIQLWAGFRYVPPTDVPAPEYYGGIASIIGDRLVRSKPGYRKVEGHVFPGVVTGVDRYPGEAAYNYFGIKREDEFDFEGGLVRDAHSSNWFVYHALNGTVFPDNWPQGGIPPGSDVFMRIYVPTPNVSYSAPGGFGIETAAWDIAYDAPGLDPNGTNQRIRRNSSLIVDLTGSSGPNIWQGVLAGTPTELHLWRPPDTEFKGSTGGAKFVTYDPDNHESVTITTN